MSIPVPPPPPPATPPPAAAAPQTRREAAAARNAAAAASTPRARRSGRSGRSSGSRPRAVRTNTTSRSIRQITAPVTQTLSHVAESTRPVWAPVARVFAWVSPLGWTVFGFGVVCAVLGRVFQWTELFVVAASAILLFLLTLLLTIGRTRVKIVSEVAPRRVVVGEPATGRVLVTNTSRAPLLPLLVELPVGVSAARFVLPPLGSGAEHEELFVVPTARRGVIPIGPARTVQGDPLGLMRRSLTWTDVTELFVHPKTVAVETLGAGLLRDLEGQVTEDQSMSDLAFHALREYQPGDDRRYIHWRSSAKAGRLLVRQFLDTRRTHVSVMVDVDPESYRSGHGRTAQAAALVNAPHAARDLVGANAPSAIEADVETAISVGGSIIVRAVYDEQDASLVVGDQRVVKPSPQIALDALSRVRPGPTDLLAAALDASELAPDASTVFLVTGPHRSFQEIRRAMGQFASEVRKVVVLVDPRSDAGIHEAGGLRILTLADLRDLRLLLVTGVRA